MSSKRKSQFEWICLLIPLLMTSDFRLTVSEDGKKALIALSGGDMRRVINVLQSTWMAYGNVTEENVYTCVGHPQKNDIQNIVGWLLGLESFQETFDSNRIQLNVKISMKLMRLLTFFPEIQELKTNKGLALEDILREIHLFVMRSRTTNIQSLSEITVM